MPTPVNAVVLASIVQLFGINNSSVVEVTQAVDHSAISTPLLSAVANPASVNINATGGGEVTVMNYSLVSTGPVGTDDFSTFSNSTGEISVYTVRKGDSLSQIAEMYNVTTNTILWANDISNALDISPGDSLVILPIVGVKHTVKTGETFNSIIKKYDADLEEVLSHNGLSSSSTLSVGDELLIPGGKLHIKPAKNKTRQITLVDSSRNTTFTQRGSFIHPAPGSIRTQGIHGFNAIDFGGAHGSSILAAAGGKVIVSKSTGWNGGYGAYIVIRHSNGMQTLYSHLSRNDVSVGQYVAAGHVIGRMGNTGRSTGTHLHFEVRGGVNPF